MKRILEFIFSPGFLMAIPICFFVSMIWSYILKSWDFVGESTAGFDLATVSAVVGGLILTGAFLGQEKSDFSPKLRRVGLLYLAATIGFVVFGIGIPIYEDLSYVPYVSFISAFMGAVSFAWGTIELVLVIPKLWKS